MKLLKLTGFNRIYMAETFPDEFSSLFGKNRGELRRYMTWLEKQLHVLDLKGANALDFMQFEHIKKTESPHIYAIRHPHSKLNERYLYVYEENESTVLLTAFMEKSTSDYSSAIKRAQSIYKKIGEDE
jgi:phage-related protein